MGLPDPGHERRPAKVPAVRHRAQPQNAARRRPRYMLPALLALPVLTAGAFYLASATAPTASSPASAAATTLQTQTTCAPPPAAPAAPAGSCAGRPFRAAAAT